MKDSETCKECNGSGVSQLIIESMTVYGPCPFCNEKREWSKSEETFLQALEKVVEV